uniref:PABS domain-containing protein n=1 Tax=Ditylum brightwellii TaxID=49249 RepID=A0A7S2ETR6_9STRA
MKLGSESAYAPYVEYLLDSQPPGQIPSAWSEAGQELFEKILRSKTEEELPPKYPTDWLRDDWHHDCGGSHDPVEIHAAQLVIQRAWDNLMIPIYDMFNHRNGHWFNSEGTVKSDEPIRVHATRDIKAGEQIYNSYNQCEDCGGRLTNYGTPEIVRDYGFVESFPQRWIFGEYNVAFEIDEKYEEGKGTGEYFVKTWIGSEPEEDDIYELRERIEILEHDMKALLSERDPAVPEREWNVIVEFTNAMVFAVNVAVKSFEEQSCPEGGCAILPGYQNLDKNVGLFIQEAYTEFTCDYDMIMGRLDKAPFEDLETVKSLYQEFNFFWNTETRATCFDIEGTVQICDDYRPHYHEMSVHYAARYLNNITRVLWVGGGDSMLLHEILKYPSLELAVGLEIDQKVVRYCYKHFGSQPHFDDEKVQWWFGDASKSLLMLPREYFGSFDLVLVDLSETVTSMSVTDKLDILGALALLVKPDGIILKNEVYFESFASMFKYSVMVNWYDNPIICSQVMAMGSNTVDFLTPTLKDTDVETLFIKPLKEIDDPFEYYHDYANNVTSRPICYKSDSDESSSQERSPGILLILEAENTSVNLEDVDALKDILTGVLEEEGLTVVSTEVAQSVGSRAFVSIILQEGYVVARTVPEHNYVGFDIHFWSSFHKQEGVKVSLLAAVKGERKASSSFRIIAGGMFGKSTWKDDEKRRGPGSTEGCDATVDDVAYTAKQVSINKAFAEMAFLVDDGELKALVLCGDDMATCESNSDALKGKGSIGQVVNIGCPMMKDFNQFGERARYILDSCVDHLVETIDMSLERDGLFNIIIIDSTADNFIASAFLKMMNIEEDKYETLKKGKFIILSAMADKSDEWRGNFLKSFKEKVVTSDPSVYVEVALYGTADDDFKLLLVTEHDDIVNELKVVTKLVERTTGLESEVRLINGGLWLMQENFQASHPYSPDDYDQVSPLEQWKSQHPLGLQVISQMESEKLLSKFVIRASLERATAGDDSIEIREYDDLGDGCVFMATWSKGGVFVLWDGRKHVDVNLFGYDSDVSSAESFLEWFQRGTALKTALYDEHPRGFGRVVSYQHDSDRHNDPHWA